MINLDQPEVVEQVFRVCGTSTLNIVKNTQNRLDRGLDSFS